MTPENRHSDHADRLLWQQCRASQAPVPNPDEIDLAAWLDGTAPDEIAARVEAWLASGQTDLTGIDILALRDVLAESAESKPSLDEATVRIERRARLLDPAKDSPSTSAERTGVIAVFSFARRGLAAAAAIAICVIGWQAGQSWAGSAREAIDSATLASEMTFGLLDADDSQSEFMAFELASFSSQEVTR